MAKKHVALKYYPTYFIFKALSAIVRVLPMWIVWRIAVAVSWMGYYLDVRHRRVALNNLDIAYGDTKTRREKRAIARGAFKSLSLTMAEIILTNKLTENLDRHLTILNVDRMHRAFDKGRGVIFLISHFGNWEIMAHKSASLGVKLVSVGRPLRNILIYNEIDRIRRSKGAHMLGKKWSAGDVLDRLGENWGVGILTDQYAGRHGCFVPFFGRPVSTTPAIAVLSMKTGAVVLPVFNVRERYGRFKVYVCEPIEMPCSGDREADIREGCVRMNRVLEEWVRRYPNQWLWMHRRWRRKKAAWEP